ncbi:MAG: hypothetical protein KC422_25720 [Trueperaceae bacterium]|nr:hypothetical protein [Trueperaceae bacterium]
MIRRETIKDLAAVRGTCISLYAPMHKSGKDTRENPIRFKNRVQDADKQLEQAGFSDPERAKLFAPAQDLLKDHEFWQHQSAGLAVFISSEGLQYYKLPLDVPELTAVGTLYHLKPLMTFLKNDGRYFVLALSLKEVRLFEASKFDIHALDLDKVENVPNSLAEALRFEVYQKHLGHHVVSSQGNATFHGHGAGEDDRKQNILYYFQQLENGVHEFLADEEAPLIFAGVDYLFPIYKEANHYPYLIDQGIAGNPDEWQAEDLHQRSWPLIEAYFSQGQKQAFAKFQQLESTEQAGTELKESLLAAYDGRVDTAFVPVDKQIWGRFNKETRSIEKADAAENGEDLLNLLAIQTFINGGQVYTLAPEAMPGSRDLAVIYRY